MQVTLTQQNVGLPMQFDLGALGERIRAGGLGQVVDPGAGAAALAAAIAGRR
mgnify:CR=1 FL=1